MVFPSMAITQVALRVISRELNGRTLTATFTDDIFLLSDGATESITANTQSRCWLPQPFASVLLNREQFSIPSA